MSTGLTAETLSSPSVILYWYVVRGSGFVAYLLLTAGVLSGLLLALRWRTDAWPRLITEDTHQFLQLVGVVFLAIHVGATLLDPFIPFRWYDALVPFTGPYRVVWMGVGIIAMYLTLALVLSFYVRRWIGYRAWRTLHYAGFAAWVLALGHALAAGTDTRTAWSIVVYAVTVVAVSVLLAVRFAGIPFRLGHPPRPRPSLLVGLLAAILLAAVWAINGPLQRGWAARAGAIPAATPVVVGTAFRDQLSGAAQPYDEYTLAHGYKMLTLDLAGTGRYPVTLVYRVLARRTGAGLRIIRGLYAMSPQSRAWSCAGAAAFHPPDQLRSVCRPTPNMAFRITADVHLDGAGRVVGVLSVSPLRSAEQR